MWTFEIITGKWFNPSGEVVSKGYAGGNCGKNPEARNNPDFIKVPKVGPLPPGDYAMGTPVEHSHLGPFAIPLTPDPTNDMHGRSAFFIHGDTTPPGNASEGCIILPRSARDEAYNSPDHQVRVVVSR
jgi:hypothetical protein